MAIKLVRIVPEAPTIIPATIITVFPNATPVAAAERPVNAFNSEITTGMSAPPIGNTTVFPRTPATTRIPKMNNACECVPAASTTARGERDQKQQPVDDACPGSLIGRPGRIS